MSDTPTTAKTTSLDVRRTVAERYGEIAQRGGGGCCGANTSCCGDTPAIEADGNTTFSQSLGYSEADLANLPEGANLGLGCGNPTAITMIQPGMTVLDLGSGAGIDCFLAAQQVGPAGRVIGVDMTDAMLERARQYATEKSYTNVEFRKGFIEALPVDDASVDLVISNCVINLSPDKAQVFREIARVLKPTGQLAVSDIVLLQPLPEAIANDVQAYIGCVSGADLVGDYLGHLFKAGLDVKRAERKSYDVVAVLGSSPEAGKLLASLPADFDGKQWVISLELLATKAR